MNDITIGDIVRICNAKKVIGDDGYVCRNFSKDTRTINKGDVYVGIKGETFNGNEFFEQAFQNGANVCILENIEISEEQIKKYKDKAIVIVDNTIKAIGQIASYKRSLYDIPVIAVTGSVGKTSTKDIIASVVSEKYKVLKTEGNHNNHIGLPFTLLKLDDHQAVVIEMGMNHFEEISYLTNIAKPTIAVITNIGTAHIGNLGSRENILKAKLEIIEGLKEKGTLIINNDNDLLHNYSNKKYNIIRYGINEKSDIMPYDINIQDNFSTYHISVDGKKYEVIVPIGGNHFVYNSLSAISVGLSLQMDMKEIVKGIKDFQLTEKRMDLHKLENGVTIINDSYNASYDSMKASLEYLNNMEGVRKIAILGDMFELGKFSKELHEKVGEEVVKNNIDILITIGELAKNISKKSLALGMKKENIYVFEEKEKVVKLLKEILKSGDILLLKASNAMGFTSILEGLQKEV